MPPQNPENENKTTSPVVASSSLVNTPAGVGIKIDNVNKSLWQYIRQRKFRELMLVVPLVIVWEIFIIFLFVKYIQNSSNGSSGGRGFGYLFFLPLVFFSSWLYKIKKQFEDAFLEEFALANGYSFDKNGTVDETYGTIFRLNGNQSISDVITGTYNGNDIRMFICETTIGSGNSRHTYQDTVLELDLHGKLPNLLMVNKKSHYGQLSLAGSFGIKNTFSLEGDFNQYFTLYGDPNNQIEALQVFSPDTMELMESESTHYTVEFSGNRIYIYANGFIGDTSDLTQAFSLAKKLIEKIAPLASRLQNDSAILAPSVNIVKNRAVHKLARRIMLGFNICLIIFGVALMVFAFVVDKHNQRQLNIDTTPAVEVSRQYMLDLGKGDIASAKSLESPGLQKDTTQNHYLTNENFQSFASSSIVSQKSGTNSDGAWVGIVYEDNSSGKPLYIKLVLSQYGQYWQIWFFQTSYNDLRF